MAGSGSGAIRRRPPTIDLDQSNEEKEKKLIPGKAPSSRQRCFLLVLFIISAMALFMYAYPSPVDPIAFRYSNQSAPELTGPLAVNTILKDGKRLFENEILGPEALLQDDDGNIYSGLADGRLIKISKSLDSYTTLTRTGVESSHCGKGSAADETICGRPLGMVFDPKNKDELYVVDSSLGLLKVNALNGSVKPLVSPVKGSKHLQNDIVSLPNGSLVITDSSTKFSRFDNRMEAFECRGNGELLIYNPEEEDVMHVILKGLFFPNGLCLSHDGQSILLVETTRARILKYYLFGERAGTTEIFSENLPGLPDNISPSASGGYWVGIALLRSPILDFISDHLIWLRSFISKFHLAPIIEYTLPAHGMVLELNSKGQIIRSLHDQGGDVTSSTSHVLEVDESTLLIGSYHSPYLIKLEL